MHASVPRDITNNARVYTGNIMLNGWLRQGDALQVRDARMHLESRWSIRDNSKYSTQTAAAIRALTGAITRSKRYFNVHSTLNCHVQMLQMISDIIAAS